jgi:alpha-tubulin suppressor-like RCC1 family protein
MRPASASASRVSRFLSVATALLGIACNDTTTPSVPAKLAFTIQPALSTTAGAPITVAVAVQDERGRTITTATDNITVAVVSPIPGASLTGTTTVAAVNGVATFTNLRVDKASGGYKLTATAANLSDATSTIFDIAFGLPTNLAFIIQPVGGIGHQAMTTFAVAVQDASGNTVTNANATVVTLAIGTNPANGALIGQKEVPAASGVASFSSVIINNTGSGYTLTAAAPNLTGATSAAFDVRYGTPSRLAFTVQPAIAAPGAAIAPAVAVAIQDAANNTVATATDAITLRIETNPASGTLSGTTTVTPVNGVATFSNLSINNAGAGYTLGADAPSIGGAISAAFHVRNPLTFTVMSSGYFHSCGVATGGAAYCWGDNAFGKLGDNGGPQTSIAVPVFGGKSFAQASAGRDHSCGVIAGGAAYCWGDNGAGKLGAGTTTGSAVPIAVSGGLTFANVSAGYQHSCGVTTGGAAYCWGDNQNGALGNASTAPSNVPSPVSGTLNFSSVSAGRFFTCGLTVGGAAYCWGANNDYELGAGVNSASQSTPVAVSGGYNFAAVSAGGFHACGLTSAGAAYCWGLNSYGELGLGHTTTSTTPAPVSGITFATISAGNRHTCGVTTAGAAYCWGDNTSGQIGDGTTATSTSPTPVSGGLIFSSVTAGRFHTCGVTTSNAGYCWGGNASGQVGDGTVKDMLMPVRVR